MLPILALMLLVGGTAGAAGCGSGDSTNGAGNEAYEEILHGLKKAALSNARYAAVSRAEVLKPTLRASIDAFCETNREMLENKEAWKVAQVGYYVVRIKLRAERNLPYVSTAPVSSAVGKYQKLYDLASFDPESVRRYAKACYS